MGLSNAIQQNSHSQRREAGTSQQHSNVTQTQATIVPRVVRLEFSRYDDSDDPITWIDQVEQFFEFHKKPIDEKGEFKRALNDDRYRPTLLEDFYEEFTKLTQTGMVRDYQPKFNRLLARARSLTEQQQISCFVSGLKETICVDVRAANPQTLPHAAGLAHLYETKIQTQRRNPMNLETK
ncbi:hypothetical protein Patl1_32526 [Pistacia atlantica]|uniref:Uncharacterized protein n=1 Tax=Pistacia atlantica TaxID=434234 RepID=A0ACC1AP25_9ROSI|nr:hypothetical protein Patl1_32526 [Pistacia atlantica]